MFEFSNKVNGTTCCMNLNKAQFQKMNTLYPLYRNKEQQYSKFFR